MILRASQKSSAGFTLVELIISAALMTMILSSAYLCLTSGLSSQKLIDSRIEAFQNGRVAMALISADLRGACPLSKEFEFVGMHRTLGDVQADNLDFATHNYTPRGENEGDFCEVSYFLEQERTSGKYSLWRRRDPTPDPDPFAGGTREEIARGLRALKFEYYDGFDWFEEWGNTEGGTQNSQWQRANAAGLPEAVRITLWLQADTRPESAGEGKVTSEEPPLVFQTVVRLNLASTSGSGSSSTSGANSGGATSPSTPQGGRP
jgi:type II secretion system protein J